MLFLEAIAMMKQGKYMHRIGWKVQDGYLALMPGIKHVWKFQPADERPNVGEFRFTIEDFEASDWEVYAPNEVAVDLSDAA